jgi:predicted restriction endonuclease
MKLVNFASFDPAHRSRGVQGLGNAARMDKQIWDEFNSNWEELAVESERSLAALSQNDAGTPSSTTTADADIEALSPDTEARPTEATRIARVRLAQSFFRRAVLASYDGRCCICRLACDPLLVASHIVPWATRPDLRINPRNGLCLCALHDRAFDRGLIAIDTGLVVRISAQLSSTPNELVVGQMFLTYAGSSITLPEKFQPDPEYLTYHFQTIFRAT